uniref:ATP synthase subunit a n=1 Tax=Linyphia triangularis TaxID=94031 RepID=A0A7L7S183_LINTI|nr:ATP synthase F0 subunit 6 [Linyphia triangularis]
MNLFSVFDPSSYFGLSFNWVMIIISFFIFFMKYFFCASIFSSGFSGISFYINKMFKDIAGSNYMGMIFISVVTFMYLVVSNLMGLFPFVFAFSSHPYFTLGCGLTLWMSFFLMGWIKNFSNSAAHLVPEGSPMVLAPFMVLIEAISHLMRPFTLSIRLAANMMAGHLIIMLLASISSIGFLGLSSSLLFQSMLLILELGVSVIQGFVFSILLLLYGLEYY